MDARPGWPHRDEEQEQNAREDVPRELRVRGITEERWDASDRANAEQEELAKRPDVRDPLQEEVPPQLQSALSTRPKGATQDDLPVRDEG